MVFGWQDWSSLRRSDGTFLFRAQWLLRNGTLLDLTWHQISLPTAGRLKGFQPVSETACQAALYSDELLGPECTSFGGLGLSSEPDICVLDGSALDACHFSCIGTIQPHYTAAANKTGPPTIPGPFGLLAKAYRLWIMEGSAISQAPAGTVEDVTANLTLAVDDPSSFVSDPSVKWAVTLTFAQRLSVSVDAVAITLAVASSQRRLGERLLVLPRSLGVANSLVSVGVRVAVSSAAQGGTHQSQTEAGSAAPSKSSSSLVQSLQSMNSGQLSQSLNTNLQQTTGQPIVVKVQTISSPQVSFRATSETSTAQPFSSAGAMAVGVVRKGLGHRSCVWSVAIAFMGVLALT